MGTEKTILPLRRALSGLALAVCLSLTVLSPVCLAAGGEYAVYFSPRGGCTEAIVKAVGAARTSILVQAYSFTSRPIAAAMAEAQGRGVKVKIILDPSNLTDKHSVLASLAAAGILLWIDAAHHLAHNKVIIIDDNLVITGSFNFTRSAEMDNAENLLVIQDRELAARYRDHWENHLKHARPYGKGAE